MGKTRASMEPAWGKAREKQYGEKLTPGTNRRSSPLVIFSSFQNSIAPNVSVLKKGYFCSSGRCLSTSGKRQVFNVRVGLLLSVCEVSQVLRMSSPPWIQPAIALIVLEKNCRRQKVPTVTFCQKPFSAVRQRQQRLLGLNSSAEGDFYISFCILSTPPPT